MVIHSLADSAGSLHRRSGRTPGQLGQRPARRPDPRSACGQGRSSSPVPCTAGGRLVPGRRPTVVRRPAPGRHRGIQRATGVDRDRLGPRLFPRRHGGGDGEAGVGGSGGARGQAGRCHVARHVAVQGHHIGAGGFGHVQRRLPLCRVVSGGVQDDGLAAGQQGGRAVEQGGVGPGRPFRRVQALAITGGRGLLGRDPRQLLAEAVAAEQGDPQPVG